MKFVRRKQFYLGDYYNAMEREKRKKDKEKKMKKLVIRVSAYICVVIAAFATVMIIKRIGDVEHVSSADIYPRETVMLSNEIETEAQTQKTIETENVISTLYIQKEKEAIVGLHVGFENETEEETDEAVEAIVPSKDITMENIFTLQKDMFRYPFKEYEFNSFIRCVEAEVTGSNPAGVSEEEAYLCKLHVAQVILNRIESPLFPNDMEGVIYEQDAFSPVGDGRFWDVNISDVTIQACIDALLITTEDTTMGCEYFAANTDYCAYGEYMFTDAVGHSFFKSYK